MRPSGPGKSSTKIGSLLSLPSIVIDEVRPTEVTPGTCAMRLHDLFVHAARSATVSGNQRLGNRHAQRQHLLRVGEARIDLAHRLERADHQAGRDEQDDSQRDLDDHQRVARAVALACRRSTAGRPP